MNPSETPSVNPSVTTLTPLEKETIAKKIKNTTELEAIRDYKKLKKIDLAKVSLETRIGNKFVDRFTFLPRLETISKKGMSYFEFIHDTAYHEKKYIQNLMNYQKGADFHVALYRVFKLHCGSIGLFKPLNAMEIYAKYRPQSVLDFTMGWGGRLVGACVENVPNYIGIDINQSLKEPYGEMVKLLETQDIQTRIQLMFQDALTVDYAALDYDCVFTSPPYYNIEIYEGTEARTDEAWNQDFYVPLFTKTYRHLKAGGHFILNVAPKLYQEVCIGLFGEADEQIPLKKKTRPKNSFTKKDYNEYMYVWSKK
jgi:hypothetical protein